MRVWNLVKRLSVRQLFLLTGIMLQSPLLIRPTLRATRQTMTICDLLYKKEHHLSGKANAFRHSLWNVLICQKAFAITKNETKATNWAQKVTDLHEKLAPNEPLETAMDLHNNEMGRAYFEVLKSSSEQEVIDFLKKNTENAVVISEIDMIAKYKNDLVYLSIQ